VARVERRLVERAEQDERALKRTRDHRREMVRAAGAKPRRRTLGGLDARTASERRTADMAATGMTNREIARRCS
jgi:hypothetical protein